MPRIFTDYERSLVHTISALANISVIEYKLEEECVGMKRKKEGFLFAVLVFMAAFSFFLITKGTAQDGVGAAAIGTVQVSGWWMSDGLVARLRMVQK